MLTDEQPRTPDVARTMQVQRKTEEKKQWAPISIYLNLSLSLSNPPRTFFLRLPATLFPWNRPSFHGFESIAFSLTLHTILHIVTANVFPFEQISSEQRIKFCFVKISHPSPSLNLTLRRPNTREERISPRSIRKRSVVENSRENFV